MEDLGFDIGGILTEEEADKLFEEQVPPAEENEEAEKEQENEPIDEKEEDTPSQEKVDVEDEIEENAISPKGDGASPNVYSSIANALKEDGIFPDFEDTEIDAVKTPEDFAELFRKAIAAGLDEQQKRVYAALENGVEPESIRAYEQTLQYLSSITKEALSAEGEEGENLRRQIIYNDLINRGYSKDKAQKELDKSFKSGMDVDDANDALEALNKFYKEGYEKLQNDAKKRTEEARENQKKQAEDFKKLVLEDEVKIGETKLDKRTCQQVFDAVSKPIYKDPDTGKLLTAVQKFQKEKPLEFLKQLGMWYVLTDGGKNTEGFTKQQVRAEKNKGIKELERKINSSNLSADGALRYAGGHSSEDDVLLSDDWNVGWTK